MRAPRGFLILSLLLLALLLVICLGMLLRQPVSYGRAWRRLESLQARYLAEAGLENLRVQLGRDWSRIRNRQESALTWLEWVYDPISREALGAYRITLDRSWEKPSMQVLRVESEGLLGSVETPKARYIIQVTLDLCPLERPNGPNPNPDFFRWTEWNESQP